MNVMLRSVAISMLSILPLLSGCAQRDNRFDPSSPLHVDIPPVLKVSCNFGISTVLKSISDSEFIVRSHTKVTFDAGAYEADSDKPLPVLVKTVQNGEIKNIKEYVTNLEIDLGDSGRTEIIFETIDEARLSTGKKFTFDIKPYKKPVITSFKTESDTIRIGRNVDAVFVSAISDPDTMLDSIKLIWGVSQVLSKMITSTGNVYFDSTHIQLLSNSAGTTCMYLIAIDREGRTDTSSLLIVSNYRGKIGNLVPPNIEKIGVQRLGLDSNFICFSPVVTVYNGDIAKAIFTWSLGGDNISNESDLCKKFLVPGTYKVFLTVEDQEGAAATDSVEIVIPVLQKKPLKIYKLNASPDTGYAPLRVDFQVVLPPGADPRDVSTVLWRFGDGPSKTGELRASHEYDWPGDYLVKVILLSNGGSDTICGTIHVFSHIGFNFMAPVLVGQKTAFWVNGFYKQNDRVFWMFPDTQFLAKPQDTCFVAFRREGPNEVKVDIVPEGGDWFDSFRLGSIICLVVKWW